MNFAATYQAFAAGGAKAGRATRYDIMWHGPPALGPAAETQIVRQTEESVTPNRYLLRIVGVALMVAGAFVALRPRVVEFLAVDSCLDHGGSYDYVRRECDHVKNHPYVAWSTRSHGDASLFTGGSLVAAGLVVLVLGRSRPGRIST